MNLTWLLFLTLFWSLAQHETSGLFPTHAVFPTYPLLAKATHIEAQFRLELRIGTSGEMLNVSVMEKKTTLPSADATLLFLPELIETTRQWRYGPSSQPRSVIVDFKYKLSTVDGTKGRVIFRAPSEVEIQDYTNPRVHINWGPVPEK